MTERTARFVRPADDQIQRGSGSASRSEVALGLEPWRDRLADSQSLVRLTLALLQGPGPIGEERCAQLARFHQIEGEGLLRLTPPDLSALRGGAPPRVSGFDLRGPDAIAAELYLLDLRNAACRALRSCAAALRDGHVAHTSLAAASDALATAARAVALLLAALYPRASDPGVTIDGALACAAAAHGGRITLQGDSSARVRHARGLVRLLGELIAAVGGAASVHAEGEASSLALAIAPESSGPTVATPGREQLEFYRLIGHLLRARAEWEDGAFRLRLQRDGS